MTERKQPKEQIAHRYRYHEPAGEGSANVRAGRPANRGRRATGTSADSHTRRRVVRTPESIVEPTPWAERHGHQRHTAAEPRANTRFVQRSLAKTGVSAPEGQVRFVRPMPRMHINSPVPTRSGLRQARRGGVWKRLLGLLGLTVVGVLGVSFALTGPTFRVQQVDVEGTQNRSLVLSIEHMGAQDQNIFLLDAEALTSRIDTFPVVASVDVAKQVPNQLKVTVIERVPVLLWQTGQGTYSVDKSGVVIAPASETTGAAHLLTVVDTRTGIAVQQVHPGTRLNTMDITFAMQIFAQLPQMIGNSSFTLRFNGAGSAGEGGNGSYVVSSSTGWLAYLGGADDTNPLHNRLIELQQILNLAQQQQLSLATVDLRFGLRPVYTLKS
ncbi:MAG TPA: FtsQ-type POTRA domain-containing protein [Ktedonobacteraceae bacterium]